MNLKIISKEMLFFNLLLASYVAFMNLSTNAKTEDTSEEVVVEDSYDCASPDMEVIHMINCSQVMQKNFYEPIFLIISIMLHESSFHFITLLFSYLSQFPL